MRKQLKTLEALVCALIFLLGDIQGNIDHGRKNEQSNRIGVGTSKSYKPYVSCWIRCKKVGYIQLVNCTLSKCTRIPEETPSTTRILIMRENNIKDITRRNFKNLTQLVYLDLSHTKIQTIEMDAFLDLIHLEILNLSRNRHLKAYPDRLFSSLNNLTQLFLTSVRNVSSFGMHLLKNLTKLEKLWFGHNLLFQMPDFRNKHKSLMPHLRELGLENNNIVSLDPVDFRGLESLETLILSGNGILSFKVYTIRNMKRLTRLELDRNLRCVPAFRSLASKSLKHLSLNDITPSHRVKRSAFELMESLETLSLARSRKLFQKAYPFDRMKTLVNLNVRGNGIRSHMIRNITANLPNLRFLDLTDNDLDVLMADMFRDIKLEVLLVGENWLTSVSVTSLPTKTWNLIKRVDFSLNPFDCDCKVVWFRRWLNNPKKNAIAVDLNNTKCFGPKSVKDIPIKDLQYPTDEKCFSDDSNWCLDVTAAIASIVCVSASVASILYRFRWRLKFYYFQHQANTRLPQPLDDLLSYEFDAFISYNDYNRTWVLNQLCPRLESEYDLRLCIQDRDWLAGRDIIESIEESITQSRKTVLIVSNAFAMSPWSNFELMAAQTKYFEDDRDNLILVLMEEIIDCNMNPRLKLQMQKKSFIEWTEDAIGQRLFWAQLKQALTKSSASLINSIPPRELFASCEV